MLFKPPKSGALKDAIENRSFPSIILDILVGSKDEHFLPEIAEKLSQVTKGKTIIIDNEGHRLNHETVKTTLIRGYPTIKLINNWHQICR